MHIQGTWVRVFVGAPLLGAVLGCGQAEPAGPRHIEDLPVDEVKALPGLGAAVEVIYDDRGIPHIYAQEPSDAFRAQGYVMARDRMGQMEFLKRGVTGRLAELVGSLDPSLVAADQGARWLGFHRQAQAIWDSLAGDAELRASLQAFADGVNAHLDELRDGTASLPGILPSLLPASRLGDWTPQDTLALARYQTYSLSYTGWDEVDRGLAEQAAARAFPAGDPDPRLARRAGLFLDLWPLAPATEALSRPGFLPNPPPRRAGERAAPPPARPRPALLDAMRRFGAAFRAFDARLSGPDRGSNNWAVAGERTEAGVAVLCSDPHLQLTSPPVFWLVHLNTARAGGAWDCLGLSFAGTPGVTLGFNRDVAWGATVSNFDVTDVYQETITPGLAGAPDTVLFQGGQVPIETQHEVVRLNTGDPVEFDVELVPHHGPILRDSRTPTEGLSVRWTGEAASNEIAAFLGFATARDVDDLRAALGHFEVGGQNFVFATRDGDLFWSSRAHVPVRDPRAFAWSPESPDGPAPDRPLPGAGEAEWIGRLPDESLPWDENPARGYLATANQDPVGTNSDGDPFNDTIYLGWGFDLGHRMRRVDERLSALTQRGGVTREELAGLQGDHRSPLGAELAPALVQALTALAEEQSQPGSHPDLAALVGELGPTGLGRLVSARERLAAWTSFETPAGLEHEASPGQIEDSIAASLFEASLPRLARLVLDDELVRLDPGGTGPRPEAQDVARTLQWAVQEPQRLATYDAALGDTVLWDDLATEGIEETRNERLVRAVWQAVEYLETRLGPDMAGWQWGQLHTLRLQSLIPVDRFDADIFSIPPPDDPAYPNGFPRHGDNFSVDPAGFGVWEPEAFGYSHGPTQRLVVELGPNGPRAWNALPGGQQHDPAGPHHADEAELWRRNQTSPLAYEEPEVVQHAERRLRLVP